MIVEIYKPSNPNKRVNHLKDRLVRTLEIASSGGMVLFRSSEKPVKTNFSETPRSKLLSGLEIASSGGISLLRTRQKDPQEVKPHQ